MLTLSPFQLGIAVGGMLVIAGLWLVVVLALAVIRMAAR